MSRNISTNMTKHVVNEILNRSYNIDDQKIEYDLIERYDKPSGVSLILKFDLEATHWNTDYHEQIVTQMRKKLDDFILKSATHEIKFDKIKEELDTAEKQINDLRSKNEELEKYKTFYDLYRNLNE